MGVLSHQLERTVGLFGPRMRMRLRVMAVTAVVRRLSMVCMPILPGGESLFEQVVDAMRRGSGKKKNEKDRCS
jgi:hypothetical protein